MSNIWDDPELGGDEVNYLKLDKVGDGVQGVITVIDTKTWDDGKRCPQLTIMPPGATEPVVWTAGQMQAVRQLKDLRPSVGDLIKVRLDDVEKRPGGKTLKHISVDVTPAGTPTASASAPAAGATADGVPAGLDPVAWAALPAEQRAAVLAGVGAGGAPAAQGAEPPF